MMRKLSLAVYILILLFVAALPFVAELPLPRSALAHHKMSVKTKNSALQQIELPHRWHSRADSPKEKTFTFTYRLEEKPPHPLYLFVPAFKQRLIVRMQETEIYDSHLYHLWNGPLNHSTALVALPVVELHQGLNELSLFLSSTEVVPAYLSEIYIGTKEELAPYYRMRNFLNGTLKAMMYSAQFLLGVGVFVAFLFRTKEKVFGWMAAMVGLNSLFGIVYLVDIFPWMAQYYRAIFVLAAAPTGFSAINLALSLTNRPVPVVLLRAVILVPLLLLGAHFSGLPALFMGSLALSILIMIMGLFIAVLILTHEVFIKKTSDVFWILGPLALISWYVIHDGLTAAGIIPGVKYVAQDVRPVLLAVLTIIMMRRLSLSLNALDVSQHQMELRLQEQKQELDHYHIQEREMMQKRAVDSERQRLIADLHDGVGGNLVSMIAMLEDPGVKGNQVANVAKSALDDLRMVIHSLDIEDDNLRAALVSFREQLEPRLRSIGIKLEWSMASMPDILVEGPRNVLCILRVLQEAVTNAIKHGQPQSIKISATPDERADFVLLTVENSGGTPFSLRSSGGVGLVNMKKRATMLGGTIEFIPITGGTRMCFRFPSYIQAVSLEPAL